MRVRVAERMLGLLRKASPGFGFSNSWVLPSKPKTTDASRSLREGGREKSLGGGRDVSI